MLVEEERVHRGESGLDDSANISAREILPSWERMGGRGNVEAALRSAWKMSSSVATVSFQTCSRKSFDCEDIY